MDPLTDSHQEMDPGGAEPSRTPQERLASVLANILTLGVLTATLVLLFGGILYLSEHGTDTSDRTVFCPIPTDPLRILRDAFALQSLGLIRLGLLLLILTPVVRVFVSLCVFVRRRDITFILLTLIVLVVLLSSFLG